MNYDDFQASPSGKLVRSREDHWTFLPNPLPPKLDFSNLIEPLQDASMAIGNLNGSGRQIENPYLVIRPLLRREALLSSSMEGTFTTANALVLAETGTGKVDETSQEVFNYILAFEQSRKMLEKIPLSNRLIKGAHNTLLSNLGAARGAGKSPGEYKNQQNFIGGSSRNIDDARFVPPSPEHTEDAMAKLEQYINRDASNNIPPLIDAALMHYQFETIHPFADGNGRVGRILIPLYLIQKKILNLPLLFVSTAVEGRKQDYVDAMLEVSKTGDWNSWIEYFLQILTASCNSTVDTIYRLLALQTEFRRVAASSGGSAKLAMLTDELFSTPIISIPNAARIMNVSYPAAQNAVNKLVTLKILEELKQTNHPRHYACWQVVNATNPF